MFDVLSQRQKNVKMQELVQQWHLATITNNIKMADDNVSPICQDTGLPTFKIKTPVGVNQIEIKKAIYQAIAEATKNGKLRPNSVDSLTGRK